MLPGHNKSMRRKPPPHSSPDELEAAFYEALQTADLDRLMGCWADEDEIVCVHPGGARLIGPAAIRESFEALFANGRIACFPERIRRMDVGGCAVHSVLERVEVMSHDGARNAYVLATNVYAKTAQGWRLLVHHASPGGPVEQPDATALPKTLH